MRRIILSTLIILISALSSLSQTSEQLSTFLSEYLASGAINPASTAVYIYDIAAQKALVSHNAATPLLGASTMKTVTIASLYEKINMDYTYDTQVIAQGDILHGELHGNLLIKAVGDPTINSDRDPMAPDFVKEIISALQREHISSILGKVIIDESYFSGPNTPGSWSDGDKRQYYGTGSHAFNFERNKSGSAAVADPSRVFLNKLNRELKNMGISIGDSAIDISHKHKSILTHHSGTMDEIMRSCMMRSDNLYAECLLRTYAAREAKDGSTSRGATLSREYWQGKGAPMDGVVLIDGSGLSRSNRLTAQFLGYMLTNMSCHPYYASFFPLAGEEGTLKHFLANTPLATYVAMKTGSMNGVQAYAGYKLNDDYEPTHVIVVLINNFASRDAAKRATESLLLKVFGVQQPADSVPDEAQN
jgi:D-alanyl-D-alanine carboxypeptidase/D-alanyl-D-alanine-endopeptidase (penicillin-binding protein 4)